MNKDEIISEFIPKKLRTNFTIERFREKKTQWELKIVENIDLIPEELKNKVAVLNGFMNPVEVVDFPFKGKLVRLQFYRRRWKQQGEPKNYYHNSYEFHKEGMKATDEFGVFLKELDREELTEFCSLWPVLRGIVKTNI